MFLFTLCYPPPFYTLLRFPFRKKDDCDNLRAEQRRRATVILYHQYPIILFYKRSDIPPLPSCLIPLHVACPSRNLHPSIAFISAWCLEDKVKEDYYYNYKQRIGDYHIISYHAMSYPILKVLTRFFYKIYWLLFPNPPLHHTPYLIYILLLLGSSLF